MAQIPTPPPVPPRPPSEADRSPVQPKAKTRTRDVIKAAISRPPSRASDQVLYWGIRTLIDATKSLGFPVVVSFLLLWGGYQFGNKFIEANKDALKSQQELSKSNNEAAVQAIKEMAQAQNESNEITRSLMMELGMRPPPRRGQAQPPKGK